MADFPNATYAPRQKENYPGVIYDETKKDITFAEDVQALDDEVVAIETILGQNPQGAFSTVNERIQKLEDNPPGGASAFTDLTDAPGSYTGQGGKAVKVKADESGLEFGEAGGSGGIPPLAAELGEDVAAGDVVEIYQDNGAKIRKARDVLGMAHDTGAADVGYGKIVALEANKWIIFYRKSTDGNKIYAIIATYDGTDLTLSGDVKIHDASAMITAACRIDANTAIVFWYGALESYHGYGLTVSISGTTITAGTAFDAVGIVAPVDAVCGMGGNSKFTYAYRNGSGYPTARCGTVTAGVVTLGAALTLEAATSKNTLGDIKALEMGEDFCIIGWLKMGGGYAPKLVDLTAATRTLTLGTVTQLDTGNYPVRSLTKVGDYDFLANATVGGVNGLHLFYAEPGYIEESDAQPSPDGMYISNVLYTGYNETLDYDDFYLICSGNDADKNRYLVHGYLPDGEAINYLDETKILESGQVDSFQIPQLNETIPLAFGSLEDSNLKWWLFDLTRNIDKWTGIMAESGSLGQTKNLNLPCSINEQQSGLTIGAQYFLDLSGQLTQTNTGHFVGIATDTTKLLIIKQL